MTSVEVGRQGDVAGQARRGLIGGILAGIVFAMFEMIAAVVLMGPPAFFMPLRMIGAIVLGPAALEPAYPLPVAAMVGMGLHLMNSALYGAVFAVAILVLPRALRQTPGVVLAATAFGVLLWLVNFFVIAPVAGWRWFPEGTNHLVQFVAHAFAYGTLLGAYVARRPAEAEARVQVASPPL